MTTRIPFPNALEIQFAKTSQGDAVQIRGPQEGAGSATQVAVPQGGGRVVIDRGPNGRTTITSMELPPQVVPLAQMAQETALGLMGLLAAIFILGPFARMFARRMEKRPELQAAAEQNQLLQQQLRQLQESIDTMSVEMERISESQRFQSKLLFERRGENAGPV